MTDFELYKERIAKTEYTAPDNFIISLPLLLGATNRILTATKSGDVTAIARTLDAIFYAGQHYQQEGGGQHGESNSNS